MELTVLLCIKCECAASIPAPLPCLPLGFAGFCSTVGGIAIPSSLISTGAARGKPRDQFLPANLSKVKMAFDGPGFPTANVNEVRNAGRRWGM